MTKDNSKEIKSFENLSADDLENLTIQFAPGCFDDFEGSQEELDELVAELTRMIKTGEIFDQSEAVDLDELAEEDPELAEKIITNFSSIDSKRTLQ